MALNLYKMQKNKKNKNNKNKNSLIITYGEEVIFSWCVCVCVSDWLQNIFKKFMNGL